MDKRSDERELRGQTAEIKRSARAVEKSIGQFADSADRRTVLSADRTLLAAERTYAAWVRTALAAIASGIGATALTRDMLPQWVGKLSGTVLVIFAGFCLVAAVWRELRGASASSTPTSPDPEGAAGAAQRLPAAGGGRGSGGDLAQK